jgi:hypothetical protein
MKFPLIRVIRLFDSADDFRLTILTLSDEFFDAFRIGTFVPG